MTNIERLIERLYESKPDKEEYDMKKIINPWKDMEGYNCFGCSPDNEAGVRMEFYEDGDEVVSIWKPRPEYQGWLNTLHGGIQSVLLDEICGWVVFRKLQTGGVTSKNGNPLPQIHIDQRHACGAAGFASRAEAEYCYHRSTPV